MKTKLFTFLLLFSALLSKAQWQQVNGIEPGTIHQIISHNNDLYAATPGGIYHSVDNGLNWTFSSNGITQLYDRCIFSDGTDLFTGTEFGGIFRSVDNGQNWSVIYQSNQEITGITRTSAGIFASRDGGHVIHSDDNGLNWVVYNSGNGLPTSNCYNITSIGTQLFVLASMGIYTSTDNGQTWTSSTNGISSPNNLSYLIKYGSELFTAKNNEPFISVDNGQNWTSLLGSGIDPNAYAYGFLKTGSDFYFSTNYGLYKSSDGGLTWTLITSNFCSFLMESQGYVFYAGHLNDLATLAASNDGGATWSNYGNGINAMFINTLLATDQNLFSRRSGGMQVSSDQGNSFSVVSGFPAFTLDNLYFDNGNIMATAQITGSGGGLLQGPLSGSNFTPLNGDLTENNVTCFFNTGTCWLLGSSMNGVYRSVNNGVNWLPSSAGVPSGMTYQFAKAGNSVVMAHNNGIFVSNDDGQTWSASTVIQPVRSIVNINGVLLGSGINVIYRSTDNGQTWNNISTGTNPNIIYKLEVIGNTVMAGTRFGGVRMSQDDGQTWSSVNTGLQDTAMMVFCFAYDQNNVYFGTFGAGIWKRGLSELNIVLPTLVTNHGLQAINSYPNPFQNELRVEAKPNSIIGIYDLSGRKIIEQKSGSSIHSLNTEKLVSGLYLLEIREESGKLHQSKIVKE